MGHILHDGCGEKKTAPKTQSGVWDGVSRFGRNLWKVLGVHIFLGYMLTGLYWWLGLFETCNVIQPNQANPCCWGLHRSFLVLAHSGTFKKNSKVSVLSVFQHVFSWNIFLHHLVLHRFVSWRVNKDVWGAPLLEPFGLLKHEKKKVIHDVQRSYCSQRKTSIPVSALAGP